MKTNICRILAVLPALALLLAGCTVDDPGHPTDLKTPTGRQVFKNYVAVGNSLTAGFMDGAVMEAGQAGSYPVLVARQIGFQGFTQPTVARPGAGGVDRFNEVTGTMYFTGQGVDVLGTTPLAEAPLLAVNQTQAAPYHNLAVPGARIVEMFGRVEAGLPGQPTFNPFFSFVNRVALYGNVARTADVLDIDLTTPTFVERTYQSASLGAQAIAKGPTLVTFWAGANDVLGWASRGGSQSPVPITPLDDFRSSFFTALQLLAGGLIERTGFPPTIVVGNLPSITSAPFFMPRTTVFEPMAAKTNADWTSGYAETDPVLVCYSAFRWFAGGDEANGYTPPDLGVDQLPNYYTLTQAEIDEADQAIDDYNLWIGQYAAAVTASGKATVAVVDFHTLMADIADGTSEYGPFAGQHFLALALNPPTADRALETLFSLDGIHPNNRGYGVVANAFLDAIETATGTDIAPVDVSALVWDPTYADYRTERASTPAADGLLSPAAGRALDAMPR